MNNKFFKALLMYVAHFVIKNCKKKSSTFSYIYLIIILSFIFSIILSLLLLPQFTTSFIKVTFEDEFNHLYNQSFKLKLTIKPSPENRDEGLIRFSPVFRQQGKYHLFFSVPPFYFFRYFYLYKRYNIRKTASQHRSPLTHTEHGKIAPNCEKYTNYYYNSSPLIKEIALFWSIRKIHIPLAKILIFSKKDSKNNIKKYVRYPLLRSPPKEDNFLILQGKLSAPLFSIKNFKPPLFFTFAALCILIFIPISIGFLLIVLIYNNINFRIIYLPKFTKLNFTFIKILADKIHKHYIIVFIIISSIFGSLMIILTPPFQVPDEIVHCYRICQIGNGYLFPVPEEKKPFLPDGIIKTVIRYNHLPFHSERKIKPQFVINEFKISPRFSKCKLIYVSPNVPDLIVPYLPQLLAFMVCKRLDMPLIYFIYGGRFLLLCSWIITGAFILKIIPFPKLTTMLLLILPMPLWMACSLSYDAVTTELSFLLTAFVLYMSFSLKKISWRHILYFLFLTFLLSSCKPLYFILSSLILIIHPKKFPYKCKGFMCVLLFTGIAVVTGYKMPAIYHTIFSKKNALKISDNTHKRQVMRNRDNQYSEAQILVYEKVKLIIFNPEKFFIILGKTLKISGNFYIKSLVGMFGWLDTQLPKYIYLLIILLFTFFIPTEFSSLRGKLPMPVKLWIIFISILGIISILSLIYIVWDYNPPAAMDNGIIGVQGRYFIPFLIPLCFIFSVRFIRIPKNYISFIFCVVLMIVIYCEIITLYTLKTRFFL